MLGILSAGSGAPPARGVTGAEAAIPDATRDGMSCHTLAAFPIGNLHRDSRGHIRNELGRQVSLSQNLFPKYKSRNRRFGMELRDRC